MNFFLDENFPKSAIVLLEKQGHKVFDIRSTKYKGCNDIFIFKLAQQSKAIFLTTDKDFLHTIPHLFNSYYGIIIIALRKPNRENIIGKLFLH